MKIIYRKCIITHERLPKEEMLRIVLTPDKTVKVDIKGNVPGRGAYLKKDKNILTKLEKSRALERALKTSIDQTIYQEIRQIIE